MTDQSDDSLRDDPEIAIIGMAGRFPGANNIDAFWENIRDGVESILPLSDEELLEAGVTRTELSDPNYVKACPILEDVDKFDASFFGFSPRDASVMDPAHRLFLEIAWAAVEHAGYTALPNEGSVGVFAGVGAPLYMIENVRTNPELMRSMGEFLVRHTGNDMNFLATRVSYEMDLRGPSMNVQTACSSALTSLHLAAQSLRLGECSMALAGGSTVLFPHNRGYMYQEGEIYSPDGHCRPFDAKSAGTVFGSGAGVVVLKRLCDALDDGDTIHAVIKGSAVNNDGAVKVGYLAPGVEGQAEVIRAALADAKIGAETVTYIETHGTGTLVGDPIEVEALNEAFSDASTAPASCGIGSVKSNIGHLGEAAAAASLIKAVMALKHRQMPPSLGFETLNPAIDFSESPFFVNDTLRDWTSTSGPLRCGVTALGAGGSNCHVILEQAPEPIPGEDERTQQLLVLSAKTKAALDRASDRLADALEADPSIDLADAAYTLALGRRTMPHRRALAARDRADAIDQLRTRKPQRMVTDQAEGGVAKTVFMFPGGGAQYARMGYELYTEEPVYKQAIDDCLAIINPKLGRDLGALMFAPANQIEAATRTLEQPSLTLPSLFATEYAMACLFKHWGMNPDAMIGHSMGEYLAACLADVVSLEDAISLVMLRGTLFEKVARGRMLAVPLPEAEVRAAAPQEIDIAAANAPDLCVASGPIAAIEALETALAAHDVETTQVRIDVAAHSRMLDPILGEFRALCKTIRFSPPQLPFVSNVSGTWITDAEACDPEYWVTHLRSTVRFADGVKTLQSLGNPVLLEVGPGRTLSMLAKAQDEPMRHAFNTMRHPQEPASDLAYALTSFGRLWAAGADVEWSAFYTDQLRNRIALPTYPFERQSYWIEPGTANAPAASQDLIKRPDLQDWFYSLGYCQAPLVETSDEADTKTWLVLSSNGRDGRNLARALASQRMTPQQVTQVRHGSKLALHSDGVWRCNFDDPEQYVALLEAVEKTSGCPDHVVFMAAETRRNASNPQNMPGLNEHFFHPAYLVQALGGLSGEAQFSLVTSGLSGIDGETVRPEAALALGPVLVAPRELENLQARCIDLPRKTLLRGQHKNLTTRLIAELRTQTDDQIVVLRSDERWVRQIQPLPLCEIAENTSAEDWLREDGVYLITGGLGGIGLEVSEHLVRRKPVKLVLLARAELPDEAQWDTILETSGSSRVAQRIARVRKLRAMGAQVMVVTGDLTDPASLRSALDTARATFGPLNGVLHAAGVMDDAPLMAKTTEAMTQVLAAKVGGTLALDSLITEPLDAFIMFSSVASFLGLPGQIDYTSANAFLDAFACERAQRASGRTLVINWNAWRDIGMAAAQHDQNQHGREPDMPSQHPALDGYSDLGEQRLVTATFSRDDDWLLSEHVVKDGTVLLPGTAFLELAHAAYCEGREPGPVELTNLTFLSAFIADPGAPKRLSIQLTPNETGHDIAMYAGADLSATPLVIGEARPCTAALPAALDLPALGARCTTREWTSPDGFLDQSFMDFGPRWANMLKVQYGHSEALLELRLSDDFKSDLDGYALHPALLDMATGGAQALIKDIDLAKDFFVPMGYERVRVFAAMPQHVFSHVRCLHATDKALAYFNITLTDASGQVFAEISRFTMRRIETGATLAQNAQRDGQAAHQSRDDAMAAILREAITVPEGLDAFDRIMAQPGLVQVAASSVDVQLWSRQLAASATTADREANPEGFQRPELDEDYAAPVSSVEKTLANIWAGLLGVRQVGINDDFFELGGNSLVGVRLFAAVRKKFDVALPLATLFEAPTIAQLAELLLSRGVEGNTAIDEATPDWSPLVKIRAGNVNLLPLYCTHGSRGNVLVFKNLADRLAHNRPVYGLQARGVDGVLAPDESINAMATRYVEAIRTVQPHGPYLLAGNSGGGVISFEMAQILTREGEIVELVMMIDSLEPTEMREPITWLNRFRYLHRVKPQRFIKLPSVVWQYQIKPRLYKLLGKTISEPKLTLLEEAGETVHQAYFRSQDAYSPEPYSGDVLVIVAKDARMHFLRSGSHLGWQNYVSGKLLRAEVDAEHLSLFSEPSVSQMATAFDDTISAEYCVEQTLSKIEKSRA